jgi:thiol-disulfide isomerase/thioredoxin
MTKIKTVFSLLVLLSLLSFTPSDSYKVSGLLQGDKLEVVNALQLKEALKACDGKLVLINSWASYNANSHIENIKLAQLIEKYKEKQFKNGNGFTMISLCFDANYSVFAETLKRDNLYCKNFIVKQGFDSGIAKTYKIDEEKFGNYLLDAKGVILAKNISASALEKLLLQN